MSLNLFSILVKKIREISLIFGLKFDELKQHFQQAANILPASPFKRKEMLFKILGYPAGYSDEETTNISMNNDQESLDLANILTVDEQREMRTGDLVEFSTLRLYDAFYIYRLPEKDLWSRIQQMWSKHEITDFKFSDIVTQSQELILVPANDEYGSGVPYLFATIPITESDRFPQEYVASVAINDNGSNDVTRIQCAHYNDQQNCKRFK